MVDAPFTPEDLSEIERRMRRVIRRNHRFEYAEYPREKMNEMNADEPLKLEVIAEIPEDEPISTYTHGDFEDLCAGPHVESTGAIPAFKLLSVAGAYWRGDENRPMLQRIYGTAFESKEALDDHLERLEEARRRDHRALGRELDLFSVHDETGPGLIIWHPKGARVPRHRRGPLEARALPRRIRPRVHPAHWSFQPVGDQRTPRKLQGKHVRRYGHGRAGLLPQAHELSIPHHVLSHGLRSYRDLPMRIGELGSVYRYERGGTLHGMLRVRGMTQDDAHIFCRPDQIADEINGVLDLTFHLLDMFDFTEYSIMLSTRPEKAVGSEQEWEVATDSLRSTLRERGIEYEIEEGGGAFYGPKIDVHIRDAIGRLWQCTTVQFDFNLPRRFGLTYIGADGAEHQPYMVHRALFGSLERFMGVLIEHYGGAFPAWLAPVQATIIPIADRHHDYAEEVRRALSDAGVRAETDLRNERMGFKIREAQVQKTPYMLIVGDREIAAAAVGVRLRSGQDLGATPVASVAAMIAEDA